MQFNQPKDTQKESKEEMFIEPENFIFEDLSKDPKTKEGKENINNEGNTQTKLFGVPLNSISYASTKISINSSNSSGLPKENLISNPPQIDYLFNYPFCPSNERSKNASEYVSEIYLNLLDEEKKITKRPSMENIARNNMNQINFRMRKILINWMIEIHSQLPLKNRTLYLAIYLVDTYLSYAQVQRANLQLVAIAAFLISSKLEEIFQIPISKLIYATDNAYRKEDVLQMEQSILNTLDFNIQVPLFLDFFEILSKVYKFTIYQFHMGLYFFECFTLDEHSINFKQSTLALIFTYMILLFSNMDHHEIVYDPRLSSDPDSRKTIKKWVREICLYIDHLVVSENFASKVKFSSPKYSFAALYNRK
ncbi:MAG: hypothetical protein MJ252_05510 [archaeon]|nr:hypothetical protein [archaeon]